MLFRTHILFSIAVALVSFEFMTIPMPVTFFIFLMAATVLVDIDTKKSKAGKRIYLRPVQWIFRHRGALHSLLAAVLFSVIISFFIPWAGIGFFAGYISHLFLDFLTRAGIPLFWPLTNQKLGFILRTNGIAETILFVLLIFVDGFLIFKTFLS